MGELSKSWWLLVLRGVLTLVFGVMVIASPTSALRALVIVFGAWSVVDGIGSLILSVTRARGGERWGAFLFEGIVSLAVGIVTFVVPWATALGLYLFIAARAIATGVFQIFAAVWLRRELKGELLLAIAGICSVGFGILLLAIPPLGILAVVSLIAAYTLVLGITLIALGLRIHGHMHLTTPRPV